MTQVSIKATQTSVYEEQDFSVKPVAVNICRNALVLAMAGAQATAYQCLAICREMSDQPPHQPKGELKQ